MTQLYGGIIGKVVEPSKRPKVTSFTSSGTFHKGAGDEAELLIVAGGASGGGELGAGGGAGGVRRIARHKLPASPVTVTVGAGGATKLEATGNDGSNSIFDSKSPSGSSTAITAVGGGGGGALGPTIATAYARTGGSGGGVCVYYGTKGNQKNTRSVDFLQVLNIHSDTYDGDTTFTDTSNRGHHIIANGDVHHSTEQAKFGKSSIKFDGTLDSINLTAGQAVYDDFNFGWEDFTIEAWIYPTAFSNTYNAVFNNFRDDDNTSGWSMLMKDDGKVHTNFDGTYLDTTNTVSLNEWTHVAVVREKTTIFRYINGTEAGNSIGVAADFRVGETTQSLHIGSSGDEYTDREFTGYIDEIRITKGYCWYTENFTAPTKPFPDNPFGVQGHSGGGGNPGYPGRSGGGGGAGQAGNTGTGPGTAGTANGKGGDGIISSISGSAVTYAGGGGGGTWQGNIAGGVGGAGGGGIGYGNQQPGYVAYATSPSTGWPGPAPMTGIGVVNTGSGGGGGSNSGSSYGAGGGSGIVIVREPAGNFTAGSGVYNMHDVFHYRTQGQW